MISAKDARVLSTQNDKINKLLEELSKKVQATALESRTEITFSFPQEMGLAGREVVLAELVKSGYCVSEYSGRWFVRW